jgi:hypothetical protein
VRGKGNKNQGRAYLYPAGMTKARKMMILKTSGIEP